MTVFTHQPIGNYYMHSENLGVIGAGAWGTALALLLAKNDHFFPLWVFEDHLTETMKNQTGKHPFFAGVSPAGEY